MDAQVEVSVLLHYYWQADAKLLHALAKSLKALLVERRVGVNVADAALLAKYHAL